MRLTTATRPSSRDAVNRRGRTISVTVTCAPLVAAHNKAAGVIVLIDEDQRTP